MKDRTRDQAIDVKHITMTKMLVDSITEGFPPNIFRENVVDCYYYKPFNSEISGTHKYEPTLKYSIRL